MPKPRHTERIWPFHAHQIDSSVMFNRFKAAALSLRPRKWDKAYNANRLETHFRKAAKLGCDLVVAPEGALEGYVVSDVTWHRDRTKAFIDIAEPLDGPYITRFRKLAKELNICLCFGFAERVGKNEAFNSVIFIGNRGEICGTYHKVSETTHSTWNFCRQGNTMRAFDTPLGRVGCVICSDRWMPLLARTLVLDGAQLICIPAFGTVTKNQNHAVLARARENGVPIVEANVGMNLIISKGEITGYAWGADRLTTGFIDVPVVASRAAVLAAEREFQKFQPTLQRTWYEGMMKAIKKGKPSRDLQRSFLSERKFRKLQESGWGASKKR